MNAMTTLFLFLTESINEKENGIKYCNEAISSPTIQEWEKKEYIQVKEQYETELITLEHRRKSCFDAASSHEERPAFQFL